MLVYYENVEDEEVEQFDDKLNWLLKKNYWNGFYAGLIFSLVGLMITLVTILWITE